MSLNFRHTTMQLHRDWLAGCGNVLLYRATFESSQGKILRSQYLKLTFNSQDLIHLLILSSSCYTFPCKLVARIWC